MEETEERKTRDAEMAATAEFIASQFHACGYTYREANDILQRVTNYLTGIRNREVVACPDGPIGFNGKIIDLDK
jgi:hypothetical protein